MIVKFHKRGKGGGSGPTGYSLSDIDWAGEKRSSEPILLAGDPDETRQLIDSLDFSQKYTSGVLNFEEKTLSAADKRQIMADFEACLFPDRSSEYNILWVEHNDKGRLELNFVIPNVDLSDGNKLSPFYDPQDHVRVDTFKQITNLKYGLSNPDDPAKKQLYKKSGINRFESFDELMHKMRTNPDSMGFYEARGAIEDSLAKTLIDLNVKSREDVLSVLSGFDSINVTRKTKSSLTILYEWKGKTKKLRLEGELYERDFSGIEQRIERNKKAEQVRNEPDPKALKKLESEYSRMLDRKREYLESRYSRAKRDRLAMERALDNPSHNHAELRDRDRERDNVDVQRSETDDRQLRRVEGRNEVSALQERKQNRKSDDLLRDIADDRVRENIKRNIRETDRICCAGSEAIQEGAGRLHGGRRAIDGLRNASERLAEQPKASVEKSGFGERILQQCRGVFAELTRFFSRYKQSEKFEF